MGASGEIHFEANWGSWKSCTGSLDLLFSAPHEYPHKRDGVEKVAERGTSELAFTLAQLVDGFAIATTSSLESDPNWDKDHPYTKEVTKLFRNGVVIDLHIMKDRGFAACIGLGVNPSLLDGIWQRLVTEFVNSDITTCIGWPFAAGPRTVTSKLQADGLKAIQLELTPEFYDRNSELNEKVRSALVRFSNSL